MFLDVVFLPEALLTDWTAEGPLSGVPRHVTQHRGLLREPLPALAALEGLLPGVDSQVHLQVGPRREHLAALGAVVLGFVLDVAQTRVSPGQVLHDAVLGDEPLVTDGAAEGLLPRVAAQVNHQVHLLSESFSAERTPERFLSGVDSHVDRSKNKTLNKLRNKPGVI